MLDRACAAKVVIYGHVSKTKRKPFQYGRTHYEVRQKSVVNRFPAHRVNHSETIIAVVAFSLRSLNKTDLRGGSRNWERGGGTGEGVAGGGAKLDAEPPRGGCGRGAPLPPS